MSTSFATLPTTAADVAPSDEQLRAIQQLLDSGRIEEARARLGILARRSTSSELRQMCETLDRILLPAATVSHLEAAIRRIESDDRAGAEAAFQRAIQTAPTSFQVVRRYG